MVLKDWTILEYLFTAIFSLQIAGLVFGLSVIYKMKRRISAENSEFADGIRSKYDLLMMLRHTVVKQCGIRLFYFYPFMCLVSTALLMYPELTTALCLLPMMAGALALRQAFQYLVHASGSFISLKIISRDTPANIYQHFPMNWMSFESRHFSKRDIFILENLSNQALLINIFGVSTILFYSSSFGYTGTLMVAITCALSLAASSYGLESLRLRCKASQTDYASSGVLHMLRTTVVCTAFLLVTMLAFPSVFSDPTNYWPFVTARFLICMMSLVGAFHGDSPTKLQSFKEIADRDIKNMKNPTKAAQRLMG